MSGGLIHFDIPTTRPCSRLLVNDKTTASSQTSVFQLHYIKPYQKLQPTKVYTAIIPRARMGSESTAHEAEG